MRDDFQARLGRWTALRTELRTKKSNKEWERVVQVADEISVFARANPDLSIVGWLFTKEKAGALAQQGRLAEAAVTYERAADECARYRERNSLRSPDDFLKDLDSMRKKAESLRRKA